MGMVRPFATREEFNNLKKTWKETLANLDKHLAEDQF